MPAETPIPIAKLPCRLLKVSCLKKVEQIILLEAEGNYTRLPVHGRLLYPGLQTLRNTEEMLAGLPHLSEYTVLTRST